MYITEPVKTNLNTGNTLRLGSCFKFEFVIHSEAVIHDSLDYLQVGRRL